MSDIKGYVASRSKRDKTFRNYEEGYQRFRVGALIRQLRQEAGLTQQGLADKLGSKKSAISRIENKAEDVRLSTLMDVAHACQKVMQIEFKDL